MHRSLGRRRPRVLLLVTLLSALFTTSLTTALVAPASAATLSVSAAIADQGGSTATVTGYVVGQPTSQSSVVTSGFPNDYALALADTADETDTDDMLYVQVSSGFRADWGLQSNPGLLGEQVEVTGTLTPYFSPHPGLKSPSAFAMGDGGSDPGDPGDPGDGGPAGYYDSAAGLSGTALKGALHDIIDDHTEVSYSTVWAALRETDEDPGNSSNVVELYSRRSISKYDNGGNVDDWNREHVWAKSHGDFGTSQGPGTDLHHLRPTDVTVNGARSNLDFDNGGSGVHQCGACGVDGDSFEPPDVVKGDVARMIFYMAVRYEGDDGHPDLELNDAVGNGSAPRHGRLSVLLDWHAQDPVSAAEERRNEVIFEDWQGNRNPFIDHPEYAAQIW
ncbi:endonuclease [Nocardioides panacisoli]|uniref:endonuclease n=1 Tax=Nocardioides panacisoli TaxID=627624 RepID=UPI001C636E2F|nr:endonuclease [Nocardioides panacisoli]QYJ02723.1 endonuclease [Nocardioides panacisoli]